MKTPEPEEKVPTFEEALAELETIVAELEEGQTPLADSLARYERGVRLLRECYQLLERAERRIELLNHVDSDGQAHSEPFDDQALSLDEKVSARSRRRSRADRGQSSARKRRRFGAALLE